MLLLTGSSVLSAASGPYSASASLALIASTKPCVATSAMSKPIWYASPTLPSFNSLIKDSAQASGVSDWTQSVVIEL